ncbi:MAG: ABC transporter permease [Gemmatimonadetes bacterium]|nr:ABC transporter permease [Gemmatimonadota bacterium]
MRRWFLPVGAVTVALLLLAFGLAAAGYDAPAALAAMARGAAGSPYAFFSQTLLRATPLILIGLAVSFAFRSGALNIGAEGQFYAGAIAATWTGIHMNGLPSAIAIGGVLSAAASAGVVWGAVPAWLRLRFGVLEVISTLLLNFVAEALVSWMVTGPMQEARRAYPQSDPIAAGAHLPLLTGRLHVGFALALVLATLLWAFFTRTRLGFEFRAAGAGPRAAETVAKIPVTRRLAQALLVSGAIAGLAGGVEVSGVSFALFQNLSPGYGFTGIAVALLARLDPRGVVASGILFAALEAGAAGMQRDAGVPSVVVYVVEAVVIVAILLAGRPRR